MEIINCVITHIPQCGQMTYPANLVRIGLDHHIVGEFCHDYSMSKQVEKKRVHAGESKVNAIKTMR